MIHQTAFGGMLQEVVERQTIVSRPELLDAIVERHCKRAWRQAPCPECEETTLQTRDDSPRVWCRNCRYSFTYTRNTPSANTQLSPGELLLVFILYADTLLSIDQIAQLFEPCYDTVHAQLREGEAAFECGFPLVWERIQPPSRESRRSTKPARSARATRDNRRRGTTSPAAALMILADHAGRELLATC